MLTREGLVTSEGRPVTLVGEAAPRVGDRAPGFRVSLSVDKDLMFSDLNGRVVVLNAIPSIDTPICSSQVGRFNDEAAALGPDLAVVTVSMDLPFAIQRWCKEHNVHRIFPTSDYKYREFGRNYGLLMRGQGLLARAVLVVDRQGTLRYQEIVPRLEDEPQYAPALAAVRVALGE